MADEPRRSGRATKGVHTKDREASEDVPAAPPKPKGKGNGKGKGSKAKAVEDEDGEDGEAYIRCVCGQYEEEEETERTMICCDNCEAWQHNDCMMLPDDYSPDKYFCEQCRPGDHKVLIAAMNKGEKPWMEAAERREAAATAKENKKKGGKKGRKSGARVSEVTPRPSQDVEEGTPATRGGGGQKRKMDDSPAGGDLKSAKKARSTETPDLKTATSVPSQSRKASEMRTPSRQASMGQGAIVADVGELKNAHRKGAATSLIKLFVEQTKSAVKQGKFVVPSDSTVEAQGTQLGLRIEHALYALLSASSPEPSDAYKNQLRAITYNVKKNADLRDRLVNGDLAPHVIATMGAKDMASEEVQKRDAATKKELEKQYSIIQESGPQAGQRIRRTHKGDEYVDDQVAEESTTSHAPVRKESGVEQELEATKSPDVMSPTDSASRPPRPVSQGKPRPSIDTQRKSSAGFNIDNVWSTVQGSPDGNQQRFPEIRAQSPTAHQELPGPGTRADADIDALLKDEDVESPPYSPKDFGNSDGTVWHGVINGSGLGRFHCSAKYAAGCSVDKLRMSYHDLIPAQITINGRIDPAKADEYLCGLQYSQSSDVTVVSIPEPENSHDKEEFGKLFSYFKTKNRYGVGSQHTNPAIKDIYLMPLEVGQEIPELLKLLESDRISNPITDRMFLVPFVIKNTELAHNAAAQEGAAGTPVQQTPITPYDGVIHNYPQMPPAPALTYQQSQNSNGTPAPAVQPPQPYPHPHYTGSPAPYPTQSTAAASAQQILGPELARAPAVLQLIAQAPNAGLDEMNVVKECIQENASAAQDLGVLTSMLFARHDGNDVGATNGGAA